MHYLQHSIEGAWTESRRALHGSHAVVGDQDLADQLVAAAVLHVLPHFLLEVGGGNKSQIANLSFSRLVVVKKSAFSSVVVVVVSWKKMFFFFSKRRRRRPSNNKSAFLVRAYMHL